MLEHALAHAYTQINHKFRAWLQINKYIEALKYFANFIMESLITYFKLAQNFLNENKIIIYMLNSS